MEERRDTEYPQEEIRLGEYLAVLLPHWWKIVGLSLAVGLLTLGHMFTKPNLYKASSTITPSIEESKQNPALGAIASLGFQAGGPSKVEDLETLFKSNDLTVRVFSKYDLWPILLQDRYDAKTGKLKSGWMDRLLGKTGAKQPGDWDAIRTAQAGLTVFVSRKSGTLSLSFESTSPSCAANIVRYYLEEAKNRLQEEALERAVKNKKFIEEQIGRTGDALTRDRLFSLYGQEVEREMMARNREQFGFRIIDSPRIPDRKSGPRRARSAVIATVSSFLVWCGLFFYRGKGRKEQA